MITKRKSILDADSRNQSDSKPKKSKKASTKSKKKDSGGQSKLKTPKLKSILPEMDKRAAQIETRLPGRLAKEDLDELKMFIRSEVSSNGRSTT